MTNGMTFMWLRKSALICGVAMVSACSVGPDYERPTMAVPAAYKEAANAPEGWKTSMPSDHADRGAWWSVYDDPVLDGLERQVEINNYNLKSSEAAYRQAVAVIRSAQAGFFPTLSLAPSVTRSQSATSSGSSSAARSPARTTYQLSGEASWELDLWGRIRRTVESDVASAQASAGDLANAKLSAQATLATSYFQLRVSDELKRLLDRTVEAYGKSLQITRNQYAAGVASRSDVVQAETQLKSTQAQAINVGVTRAQLEHAIAVLVGKAPAEFSIAPAELARSVPVSPVGVPSTLLERRPDIAAAERRVALANAQIGVAIAAYYPTLTLSGSYGYSSSAVSSLLQTAHRAWSLGPSLAQTLFDGGLRSAQVEEARASWDESVATYRQTVLTAFQQVEDELSALQILEQQAAVQAEAVESAREAERLMLNQYKAGTVAYTDVVTTQTSALSNEQTALTILENRLTASVTLIQALGGGWEMSQLPADPQGEEFGPAVKQGKAGE